MPIPTPADRIPAQLDFLIEADKLKSVIRANALADGSRLENTAEHSWHLCLWALIFADWRDGANIPRVMQMLLLHDLVEIDVGDQPVFEEHDEDARKVEEAAAADRIFALLPADQAVNYRMLWDEFEAGKTADARYARMMDKAQPMFLALSNPNMTQTDRDILTELQLTGRFADLKDDWPDAYQMASNLLNRKGPGPGEPLASRMRFVMEADRLKTVIRGTTLCDGSRHENSAEHSWHIMLWALVLQEHCAEPVRLDRVLTMLLLHDLVEIDVGDHPIHGGHDPDAVARAEEAAATRLFGLLPDYDRPALRALWDEFEAAKTPDAIFAKAIDRAQPLICNLKSGGGSWHDYNVTRDQLQKRVGVKVKKGAPDLWAALAPQIDAWFAQHVT
ncbi:MAG: HD domain-containing protein [Pseudomonadota bacterium]